MQHGVPAAVLLRFDEAERWSRIERGLAALGHRIVRHPLNYDRYFARPQLAMRSGSTWTGASDPRSDGGVALAQGGRLW